MSEYFRKPIVKTLMLKGQEGQSIKEIKKTNTSGIVDTYTITLTDGTTSTFTVTNGKAISSISKTGTSELVDTYTIKFNDGTTSTFTVKNGKDGDGLQNLQVGGRNLIQTVNGTWGKFFTLTDNGTQLTKSIVTENGFTGNILDVQCITSSSSTWCGYLAGIITLDAFNKIIASDKVTLSFDVKSVGSNFPNDYPYETAILISDGSSQKVIVTFKISNDKIKKDTWTKVSAVASVENKTTEYDSNIGHHLHWTFTNQCHIRIRNVKLEIGNIATDWTPAPEDLVMKSELATVATSGSYNDLKNKPTIPTVTNDLTNALKQNYDYAYNSVKSDETVTYTNHKEDFRALVEKTISGISINNSRMDTVVKGKLVQVSLKVAVMGDLKITSQNADSSIQHLNDTIEVRFSDFGLPNASIEYLTDQVILIMRNSDNTLSMECDSVNVYQKKISVIGFNAICKKDNNINTLMLEKTVTYIAE